MLNILENSFHILQYKTYTAGICSLYIAQKEHDEYIRTHRFPLKHSFSARFFTEKLKRKTLTPNISTLKLKISCKFGK